MRDVLPTLAIGRATVCDDDGDYEGVAVEVRWLGLVVTLSGVRRTRMADASKTITNEGD